MRNFQFPVVVHTGDDSRRKPGSSTVTIQPEFFETPLYHSSTSWVTLTTWSMLPLIRATTLGLMARSLDGPLAPAEPHSTFWGRCERYVWDTPVPQGPIR